MVSTRSLRRLMKKLSASDSNNSYKRLVNAAAADEKKFEKLDLARGCVAIYVGQERKRYQVPLIYLSLSNFQQLINASQEDVFDVKIDGPITLACPTHTFEQLLKIAKKTTHY
ncbi:hypothetical protein Dsin_025391 [Dipteronia sinensis]|uniref:Small auxin up regulated protein n=1 Tax=Dipteronia sinensis TaxID=43782 RepID=A0AAD9ZVX4_9ROSI|nr:hypothetical protein Dsin_033053 [Dipteronia sinensis]KAK3180565.1 hypothetical protein Dsin_032823 [Dipteronia sinensis]KAK3194081.1 hypothetical protein Dsin_025391 [Dipteronia sinensis]